MAGPLPAEALLRRAAGAGRCGVAEPDLFSAPGLDPLLNCDPIAGAYRWLEYAGFGRALERRRFRFLPQAAKARRALVLGDGDGRFLARLLAANPEVTAEYVDSSARMLELARRRAGESRVAYRHGDVLETGFGDGEYDLVVTHFLFDFFEEREARLLAKRVAAAAAPGALWIVSEFRRTRWSAPVLWLLYFFFHLTARLETSRLIDHRPILAEYGFRLEREELAWFGLLVSELWVARA